MKKKPLSEVPQLSGERVVLRGLRREDAGALRELTDNPHVYRYLPTFLFEKKYADPALVIERLYTECLRDSLILGVFAEGEFCGLAELYGFRDEIHKISVGYRFSERFWGRELATETLGVLMRYLAEETDVEIVTASTMIENQASARVLRNNGFALVVHAADEDWGYDSPTAADKWINRTA